MSIPASPALRRPGLRVTVAIPAHDDRAGLARLLDRLDCAGAILEIIVVDDASSDDAADMVAARNPPPGGALRLLRNAQNLGPGPSRNRAIEAAGEPHLLFIDADDLPHRDLFAWLADAPPAPECDFTLFRHHLCVEAARPFTYRMAARDEAAWAAARAARGDLDGPMRLAEAPRLAGMIAFPWTRLFRTAFVQGAGLCFPDLRLHEDVPFHWAAWLRAERFLVLDHAPPLLHHFQLAGGGRATDAADARRLDAFRALEITMAAEPRLSRDAAAAACFVDFAADLGGWALGRLRGGAHEDEARARAATLCNALDRLAAAAGVALEERQTARAILIPESADA